MELNCVWGGPSSLDYKALVAKALVVCKLSS